MRRREFIRTLGGGSCTEGDEREGAIVIKTRFAAIFLAMTLGICSMPQASDAQRPRKIPRVAFFTFDCTDKTTCACRKSNPDILVVQPAENWAAKNVPGPLDGARDRRILLQG